MPKAFSQLPRLGELELSVLEHLWRVLDADVQEVHAAVGKKRGISPNTVGSALERLHKKNLLAREKVSHAYRYRAALDREAFRARRLLEAAGGLRALGKGGLLAAFVDLVADADGSALRELERLIRRKREESEG
ncbi:MAG TPA: BlaI/MecI/CopY family transcriptional regulator [Polyangiaceae bacterium]|jgi:predicted transcriptional regulator